MMMMMSWLFNFSFILLPVYDPCDHGWVLFLFSYSLYLLHKHNMFVSVSSVVCVYLSYTALASQTLKAHTVNKMLLYIENMLISVKFKLQTNGN